MPRTTQHAKRKRMAQRRRGSYVVWAALMMVVLVGMMGLVVDAGMLMATHRHAHNAVDAAALAATFSKLRQETDADATQAATDFVIEATHNNIPNAALTVNIPPATGAYAGAPKYVEAIVTVPMPTYFIHVLPGVNQGSSVTARAVAGYEVVAAGEGVITLDPDARPGLKVTGEGRLKVNGDVYVNSEGGGVDENGDSVENGNNQTAVSVSNNATVCATNVNVVGGVNDPDNFENAVPGGPNPLDALQLPIEDPLLYLPTPMVSNGVDPTFHGAPQAADGTLALNKPADSPNEIIPDPETGEDMMVLYPGVYESIKITGGKVELKPGIYVLKPANNTTFTLDITGGDVIADGIMFYNTGSDYDALDGSPDTLDGDAPPNPPNDVNFGNVKINADMQFNGIDTSTYAYSPAVSDEFDGMLFYQRRWNDASMQIEGDSDTGSLSGTLYSKWGDVKLAGQGTYDAQFIVGSMDITGQGDVTINYDGDNLGKAAKVFLVE